MDTSLTALKVLDPILFYNQFIEQSTRPDGRNFLTCRPLNINSGSITTVHGSASIRLGGTTVISTVTCECIRQQTLYTFESSSSITNGSNTTTTENMEIDNSLLSSSNNNNAINTLPINNLINISIQIPEFRNGHNQYVNNSTKAQDISCTINKILTTSGVLDPLSFQTIYVPTTTSSSSSSSSSSSILHYTYKLIIDSICTTYDGNYNDTILLSIIMAILNTKYPSLSNYTILSTHTTHPQLSAILKSNLLQNYTISLRPKFLLLPCSLTYARIYTTGKWIVDPSYSNNEELPIIGSKTAMMNKSNIYNQLINGTIQIILGIPIKSISSSSSSSISTTKFKETPKEIIFQPELINKHNYTLLGLRTSINTPSINPNDLTVLIENTINYINNTIIPYIH